MFLCVFGHNFNSHYMTCMKHFYFLRKSSEVKKSIPQDKPNIRRPSSSGNSVSGQFLLSSVIIFLHFIINLTIVGCSLCFTKTYADSIILLCVTIMLNLMLSIQIKLLYFIAAIHYNNSLVVFAYVK